MRSAETYRAARRNTCHEYSRWSKEWYYEKHNPTIRYENRRIAKIEMRGIRYMQKRLLRARQKLRATLPH